MNAQTIYTILIAILGSSVVATAINAVTNRRKVSADASEVLSGNAIKQMQNMSTRLNEAEEKVRRFEKKWYEHAAWDRQVYRKLQANDMAEDVDPPPDPWVHE